jgi:hypothetical protein
MWLVGVKVQRRNGNGNEGNADTDTRKKITFKMETASITMAMHGK